MGHNWIRELVHSPHQCRFVMLHVFSTTGPATAKHAAV